MESNTFAHDMLTHNSSLASSSGVDLSLDLSDPSLSASLATFGPQHGTGSMLLTIDDGQFDQLAKATEKKTREQGSGDDDQYTARGNVIYKALGGDDQITVRKSNNTIVGGGGDDFINAKKSKGDNVLKGGGGSDEIIGGGQNDLLVGGGGADLLVIADGKLNKGISIIKGFKKSDAIAILDVKKADEFEDLTFKKQGKDTLIRVGNRDIALVQNTKPKDLKNRADDFIFGDPVPEPPSLSIGDITVTEGNTGTANAIFTVTLNQASAQSVTVNYSTASGTATQGSDYTAVNGTLTFAPGTTSQTIAVPIVGDTVDESNETILVNLSNASNGILGDAQALGTIVDNDDGDTVMDMDTDGNDIQASVLSISDLSIIEGNADSTVTFTVTLDTPSSEIITVGYATADGTAIANNDYTPTTGTLTFAANTTSQTLTVPIIGDDVEEADETFTVNLINASGATIGTGTATATILNDDVAPEFRDKRTGKKRERPSAAPDLVFSIFDTLPSGEVITDIDPSETGGLFIGAIEDFDFTTDGFFNNIDSILLFSVGNLIATRSGDFITYQFASEQVDVNVENPGKSIDKETTESVATLLLTVDLNSASIPDDFDPVQAVNNLDYILGDDVFQYATSATAYGGDSVLDISFSPDICAPGSVCEDLEEDVV